MHVRMHLHLHVEVGASMSVCVRGIRVEVCLWEMVLVSVCGCVFVVSVRGENMCGS